MGMGMRTCFWLMWVGGDVANVCVCRGECCGMYTFRFHGGGMGW